MFIPLRTDAPVHHFPFATIAIIATNVALFIPFRADPEPFLPYLGEWGVGWKPWQWVTGHFFHAGILHLAGNMVFLWVFGLVVEGKLGAWRFLLVYFAIAIVQGAVEQTIFLGAEYSVSLGASSVIYGLLAMAWLWAPKNTIQSILFLPPLVRSVDLSIGTFALIFIGLDLGFAILRGSGGEFSSEFLHVLGAAVGLPLGIAMLRKGWVDCEGWDWFSVRRGDHIRGGAVVHRTAKAAAAPEPDDDEDRELALDGIREALAERNPAQALALHRDAAGDGGWLLPEPELRGLALLLAKEGAWEDAAPLLEEHVGRFPTGNALVRIRLAEHFLVRASRPSRARELLLGVDPARLPPAAAVHREKLLRLCQERIDAGAFELFD